MSQNDSSGSTVSEPDGQDRGPELSFVVPLYNEEACVGQLLTEIITTADSLARPYEIVAVDDGSHDSTPQILNKIAGEERRLRPYQHKTNRGQAAALLQGLRLARAPIIVTMDGDGQNDPADVPELLAKLEGYDMVVGIRAQRRDSWLRRAMSRSANAFRGRLLGDHMHDSGCALKIFRREVVSAFIPIRTLYSFMPALAVNVGFRVTEMPVHHRSRQGGTSSYGLWQFLWRPVVDMLGIWWLKKRSFSFREPERLVNTRSGSRGLEVVSLASSVSSQP